MRGAFKRYGQYLSDSYEKYSQEKITQPMQNTDNKSILEDAIEVTTGARRRDYDSPRPNHERIARLWNAYLQSRAAADAPLSALDVSHMMILLKIARVVFTPTRDSYVDIAGYARCGAQIAGFEQEEKTNEKINLEKEMVG